MTDLRIEERSELVSEEGHSVVSGHPEGAIFDGEDDDDGLLAA